MSKCVICGKEYGHRRSTSKYCSKGCKQARYRNKVSVTDVTVRPAGVTPIPSYGNLPVDYDKLPVNYGQSDCECMHCRSKRANHGRSIINHGPYKTAGELGVNEVNRVSLPGDVDYKS